jgi:rhodanese-related sulfurtransferase
MGVFRSLRSLFGQQAKPPPMNTRPMPPPEPEPDEIAVPEISVDDLRSELGGTTPPVLLDVREQFEWQQVRIAGDGQRTVLHIPMNSLPARLEELPREQAIVVLCAHGSRSYGVTHYLIEQGFRARNLTGGITRWMINGGPIER